MKYTIGTPIPDEDILRCFKDEDEEKFIEVRGMPEVLFRVTEGNRVYYKIDKSKLNNEDLTLVEDYSWKKPTSNLFGDGGRTGESVLSLDRNQFDSKEYSASGASITHRTGSVLDEKQEEENPKEIREGKKLPVKLRAKCKKNGYGYSLHHESFLYLMDANYRVEVVTPDTFSEYEREVALREEKLETQKRKADYEKNNPPGDDDSGKDDFMKGDILPAHWRPFCEAELGAGGGSRITIGDFLYIMNAQYEIMQKMKISISEHEEEEFVLPLINRIDRLDEPEELAIPLKPVRETITSPTPKPFVPPVKVEIKEPLKPLNKGWFLPPGEIVENIAKAFDGAIKKYGVNADFFRESVLCANNRKNLIRCFNGDLSQLNDDTREASSRGEITELDENGVSLFKGVLIHEFYIKTTLTGRGNKMHYFLTYIVAAEPDGTMGPLHVKIPLEEQKALVEFFGEKAGDYPDKSNIIGRVYRQLRSSIYDLYKDVWVSGENVRFNALLLAKLYEFTTRLDRGDGITMIRLVRDILDFGTGNPKRIN